MSETESFSFSEGMVIRGWYWGVSRDRQWPLVMGRRTPGPESVEVMELPPQLVANMKPRPRKGGTWLVVTVERVVGADILWSIRAFRGLLAFQEADFVAAPQPSRAPRGGVA